MTYTAVAEASKNIRAEYKRRGWNARMISVRSKSYSMGSSINVEIKDPAIDHVIAKEIAEGAESIYRDSYGEILSGGNRFVFLDHSSECRNTIGRRRYDEVLAASTELLSLSKEDQQHRLISVAGDDNRVDVGMSGYMAQIWVDGRAGMHFNPREESGVMLGAFCIYLELARSDAEAA